MKFSEVNVGDVYELLCTDSRTNQPKMARMTVKEKGYYPNDNNPGYPDFPGAKVEMSGIEANMPALLFQFAVKVEIDNLELHRQFVLGITKAVSAIKGIVPTKSSEKNYFKTTSAIYSSCAGLNRLAYAYVFEFIVRNPTLLEPALIDKVIEGDHSPAWNWANEFMLKFGDHPTVEPVSITI